MNKAYYRQCQGALIIYNTSCADNQTIERIKYWVDELRTYLDPEIPIIVIGNKSDLDNEDQIAQVD